MSNADNNSRVWMRYAGLGTQLMVLLGLGVWGGLRLDSWLHLRALFVILLPLLALVFSLMQLYRNLNKK